MVDQHKTMAMVTGPGPSLEYKQVDTPKPGKGQMLIQVQYAAQNPTNIQSYDSCMFGNGAVLGCDFVGNVVKLGEGVQRFAVGDLVSSTVWGGEIKGLGSFATYTLAEEKLAFKVPDGVSAAAASTIPLAACTAWLALFSHRCLSIERSSKDSVLVWGGSSSVGQFTIQLAGIYGLNVVTTCSPRNFDLAKSLGANHVYDYSSPDVAERIRKDVPGIKYVFDTIGNEQGSSALAASAANTDCTLCTVRPGCTSTEGVPDTAKIVDVMIWTAFLKYIQYNGHEWPVDQRDGDLGAELFENIPKWVAEGKFKPNDVLELNGLQSVPEGFQLHRDGKISAKKIVYRV